MRRTIAVASVALLLTTAACGKTNNVSVPGVGSVNTTQTSDGTKVQVTGSEGQTTTVDTAKSPGGTKFSVTGPNGQTASVDTSQGGGGTQVKIQGPGVSLNIDTASSPGQPAGDQKVTGSGVQVDPSAFSAPFYPGAQVVGGGSTETTGVDGKKLKMASAELTTKDPVDKVAAFYAEKAKAPNKVDTTVDGRRTVIYAPANPLQGTTITVTQEKDGSTRITMASHG